MTNQRPPMSFREKSAWTSFISLAIVFGIYFWNTARILARRPAVSDFTLFFSLLVALIVVEIVLHLLIAIRSPKDARAPKDERERLIELKATRTAFFVLMVGALASIGTMHLRAGTWEMAHAVLLAIVVAELARFGKQIILYRRDA
jgi:archaellum biogenesis protein FlaJ (TadC family)